MSDKSKEKLVKLLTKIFQFDSEDLDFGIYKILNLKKKEIKKFLDEELIAAIKQELKAITAIEEEKLRKLLKHEEVEGQKRGVAPENNPEYQKLEQKLKDAQVTLGQESKIYNQIYNFFLRYYDAGDFISRKRFGMNEKYAIPYNGEEVLLHWATKEQYFVKTTEFFSKFSFETPNLKVNFKIIDAEEEKANVKATEEKYFVIVAPIVWLDNSVLTIYFEHKKLNTKKKTTREKINEDNIKSIEKALNANYKKYKKQTDELTQKTNGKSLLETKLNFYTKKNTSDYFIHKDLETFMKNELEFYIKNEIVDVSDLIQQGNVEYRNYIVSVNVLQGICNKIIEFLSEVENLQKKLWEKKKFIYKTDYCITLDYVDKKHYPVILKNKKQLDEWKKLYGIDVRNTAVHSNQKEIEVLEKKPTLMIDTSNFEPEFKSHLIEEIQINDEKINGILINSENYHALNLLLGKYKNKIDASYVDPPYNTDLSPILYKNGYKDSSWLSFMQDRLRLGRELLTDKAIMVVTIDDHELDILSRLMRQTFVGYEIVPVIIEHHNRGRIRRNFATTHEYGLFAIKKGEDLITRLNEKAEDVERNLRRTGQSSHYPERPTMFYGIEVNKKTLKIVKITDHTFWVPKSLDEKPPKHNDPKTEMVWPIDDEGVKRHWYYSSKECKKEMKSGDVFAKEVAGKGIRVFWRMVGKNKMRKSVQYGEDKDERMFLDASTYGTELLNKLFGQSPFDYAKSVWAVKWCIESLTSKPDAIILDFVAGSGTTAHAVLKMNKDDGGKRKYILVEMGQYFDTVLKSRIKKVVYSDSWDNGCPQDNGNTGTKNHIIKYHHIEQYEDALENIRFSDKNPTGEVTYMINSETRESNTFLNVDETLSEPFGYKIKVMQDYKTEPVTVDLVETYNYLIGLEVTNFKTQKNSADGSRKYVTIEGSREGKSVVVIWRDRNNFDPDKDKEYITKNKLDKFDEIHLNGDSLIPGALLIEEQFKKLMNG